MLTQRENKYVFTGIALGVVFLYVTRKFWQEKLINPLMQAVWDAISEQRIEKLHPFIRNDVRGFINEVEKQYGVKLRVTQGLRTAAEQADIYAQGRTKAGKIVSNAKPYESYHNYGLAFDVVRMVNGKADWTPIDEKIAKIAEKYNFTWGGRWRTKDLPHFERNYGYGSNPLRSGLNKLIPQGGLYPEIK